MNNAAAALLRPFRTDFHYYAPRALWIKTKKGALSPFRFNRAQRYLLQKRAEQLAKTGKVRVIGLKGRQQGFSTCISGLSYWNVTGHFGRRAYTMTHRADATANLFAMVKLMHSRCPPVLRPHCQYNNANTLLFDKLQSEMSIATAGGDGVGRSATAQYFHGSEMAFWRNASDHMAGIGQILPNEPGTEIYLESTANGPGNLFHSMWMDAERGLSEYIPVFIPWYWQDEYRLDPPADWFPDPEESEYGEVYQLDWGQLYWRRQKIRTDFRGDKDLFDQEYPATPALAFRKIAGNPLIEARLVELARKRTAVEGIGATILGIDPSEYGDDATAAVLRQGSRVHWVQRRHKIGPMQTVAWVANLIETHRPDFICIDQTNSLAITERLGELGFTVTPVHFGERAVEEAQYLTVRDEMWGDMLAWFQEGHKQIPDDDILQSDLTGVTYSYDSSRRKRLETKEQMRARGLASPDSGDALALTFAVKTGHSEHMRLRERRQNWKAG